MDKLLKVFTMELDSVKPINVLILVFSLVVAMYPLISRGYVFIESPPPILVEPQNLDESEGNLLSKLVYVDRKIELLYFNSIFSIIGTLYEGHSIDVIYIFVGVVLYISMVGHDLFLPGVFKRFMTLPITREEYAIGRVMTHILIIWITMSITYIAIMLSFIPLDISVFIAGIIFMPVLLLIISLSFLVSSILKNPILSFIVSGGVSIILVVLFDQFILSLFSFTKDNINFSPIHGYLYVVGLYSEIRSLGEAGRHYAIMTDTYIFDVTTNVLLFLGYVFSYLLLSSLALILLSYVARKMEVD